MRIALLSLLLTGCYGIDAHVGVARSDGSGINGYSSANTGGGYGNSGSSAEAYADADYVMTYYFELGGGLTPHVVVVKEKGLPAGAEALYPPPAPGEGVRCTCGAAP